MDIAQADDAGWSRGFHQHLKRKGKDFPGAPHRPSKQRHSCGAGRLILIFVESSLSETHNAISKAKFIRMTPPAQSHPARPGLRQFHQLVSQCPPLLDAYRRVKDWKRNDPLPVALHRKLFEKRRLRLPERPPEQFSPAAGSIELPSFYPLFAGEDAPLNDMLFLLNLARGRKVKRILEVGTYRARTTYALHLNCPDAAIVSYDIQTLDSPYRAALLKRPNVELRHASYAGSAPVLRRESRFDLIFVDGSHRFDHVVEDSRLALELVDTGGIVVWHDYRMNDFSNDDLRVPEALDTIRQTAPIFAVTGTMCAVHEK
jgi:predicted O-methyltransferase YrrM